MATTFTRKGYGRIYVEDHYRIKNVEEIIKVMDEDEHRYLPKDLVAPLSTYPEVVYTGKFDELDLDALALICFKYGIHIWCYDSGRNEYPEDLNEKYKNVFTAIKTNDIIT